MFMHSHIETFRHDELMKELYKPTTTYYNCSFIVHLNMFKNKIVKTINMQLLFSYIQF